MKMKLNFKKVLSISLSAILVFSAMYSAVSVTAENTRTWLENGSFTENVNGWNTLVANTLTHSATGPSVLNTGNYAKVDFPATDNNWVYQEVTLNAGEYTWTFDAEKTYGSRINYGVYTDLSTIGKSNSNPIFTEATVNITNASGAGGSHTITNTSVDSLASTNHTGCYFKNAYITSCHSSHLKFNVSYKFTLNTTTTVYLAVSAANGATLYLDNVMLEVERERTWIENGDFAENISQWKSTLPNTLTFASTGTAVINTGNYAMLKVPSEGTNWIYQKVTLEPGKYIWTFDAEKTSGPRIKYGVYTDFDTIGETNSKPLFDKATVDIRNAAGAGATHTIDNTVVTETPSTAHTGAYFNLAYVCSCHNSQLKFNVSYEFTVDKKTTVYFAVSSSSGSTLYLDNVSLEVEREKTWIENGTFDENVNGWETTSGTLTHSATGPVVINTGNYAKLSVTTGATDWVYQKVTLEEGIYTWNFDAEKTSGSRIYYGVYTDLDTMGKANSKPLFDNATVFISNAGGAGGTHTITNTSVSDMTSSNHTGCYFKNAYVTSYHASQLKFNVSYKFTLNEKTTIYFAVSAANGATLYLDNVSLVRARSELENGSFDESVDGWETTAGTLSHVATGPSVINTGNYAKLAMPSGAAGWIYQEINLAAGDYTWTFDAEKTSGSRINYGVYTSLDTLGKTNSNPLFDNATVFISNASGGGASHTITSASTTSTTANHTGFYYNNAFVSSFHSSQLKFHVTYKFTLKIKTTIYLAVSAANGATLYLDNVTLVRDRTELENGTFDKDVNGWNSIDTSNGVITHENGRLKYTAKTADAGNVNGSHYVYQQIKLAPGNYTWSFDVEKSNVGNYLYFGVYSDASTIGKSNIVYKGASVYCTQATNGTTLNEWIAVPAVASNVRDNSSLGTSYFTDNSNQYCAVYTGQDASGVTNKFNIVYTFTLKATTTVYLAVGTECRVADTENYYIYLDNIELEETLNGDCNNDGIINAYDLVAFRSYLLDVIRKEFHYELSDANNDGVWDIRDLVALKKLLVNQANIQTISFSSKVQNDFEGLCGVVPCYWFLPDSTMPDGYTEEQLEISTNKLIQMGMSKVRCLNFEPAYAWDAETDQWDWNSESMQGFYKYCDLMKENNIEIIINTAEGIGNATSKLGTENPIPIVAANEEITEYAAYGNWVVDFVEEVVIKRGYDNIKYWEEATEPNNSSTSRDKFISWSLWMKSGVDALNSAGYGDYFEHIGPSVAITLDSVNFEANLNWIKWATEELNDYIDIYAAHTYLRTDSCTEDYYAYWKNFVEACEEYVVPTGKPFWCDEYNVMGSGYEANDTLRNDSLHATQVAAAQVALMANGVDCAVLWSPVDMKFPNTDKTEGEFYQGIHKVGIDRSVLESSKPYNAYYTYSLLGSVIEDGDIVYEGNNTDKGLRSILLEHKDGTYSLVVINLSWIYNKSTFVLPEQLKNATFTKSYYDPVSFRADESATLITAKSQITVSDENSFVDSIGGYYVVVYDQK